MLAIVGLNGCEHEYGRVEEINYLYSIVNPIRHNPIYKDYSYAAYVQVIEDALITAGYRKRVGNEGNEKSWFEITNYKLHINGFYDIDIDITRF